MPSTSRAPSVWRPAALVALLAAGWLAIGQRCLALGMDWYLAARYWFYAFPSYFSEVHYGAMPYTYFTELGRHFESGNPFVDRSRLEALLAAAHAKAVTVASSAPVYFPADEKGTVDFVRFAFAIFGTQLPSLLYFYLAILAVSLLLFAIRFRRDPAALLTGVVAVAALTVGVSALPITREVYSVINPRGVGSLSFIAPVLPVLVMLGGYQLYQRAAYPPEYLSTNVRNKIVWHNVLIGFALHPEIAQPYGLSLNDASVWAYVRYKAARERIPDYEDVFFDTGLVKGWRRYDELARQAIFELAATHPRQMLELYAWYKPRMLFHTLAYAAGWVDHDLEYYGIQDQASSLLTPDERRAQSAYYNPLAWLPLLLVVAGSAVAGRSAVRSAFSPAQLAALATIAVFSLLPAFLTYPLVHVVVAAYLSFTLLLYAILARGTVAVLDRTLRHTRP